MPKVFRVVSIGMLFFILGYFRNFLFVNINAQLFFMNGNSRQPHIDPFFEFLNNYSFAPLYYSKYVFTLVFVLLNAWLTYQLLNTLFGSRRYSRVSLLLFALIFILAVLSFLCGLLLQAPEQGYIIARNLAGLIQGPLPALVLIAAWPLRKSLA